MGGCLTTCIIKLFSYCPNSDKAHWIRQGNLFIVWVLGGPASGKTTQCLRLAGPFIFYHLSVNDLLLAEIESGSEWGQCIKECLDNGKQVPTDITTNLIKNVMISEMDNVKGYFIDGYPVTVEQGLEFQKQIGPCTMILYLKCFDNVLKQRMLSMLGPSYKSEGGETNVTKTNVPKTDVPLVDVPLIDDPVKESPIQRLTYFHHVSEHVIYKFHLKTSFVDGNADENDVYRQCHGKIQAMILYPM